MIKKTIMIKKIIIIKKIQKKLTKKENKVVEKLEKIKVENGLQNISVVLIVKVLKDSLKGNIANMVAKNKYIS